MCGRDYSIYSEQDLLQRYQISRHWPWPFREEPLNLQKTYNHCPSQISNVLAVRDKKLGFYPMRWGLVPAWAKTVKDADKYSMINAKSEEISEKRSYQAAFRKRRGIIPVSGFYEWKREEKKKTPYAIHLENEPVMSLAAIWEHWVSPTDGEVVDSYSIVTLPADDSMKEIHHRMPLILKKEDEEKWLDPEIQNPKDLEEILKTSSPDNLRAFEISSLVNSPRNNSPEVLEARKDQA